MNTIQNHMLIHLVQSMPDTTISDKSHWLEGLLGSAKVSAVLTGKIYYSCKILLQCWYEHSLTILIKDKKLFYQSCFYTGNFLSSYLGNIQIKTRIGGSIPICKPISTHTNTDIHIYNHLQCIHIHTYSHSISMSTKSFTYTTTDTNIHLH